MVVPTLAAVDVLAKLGVFKIKEFRGGVRYIGYHGVDSFEGWPKQVIERAKKVHKLRDLVKGSSE